MKRKNNNGVGVFGARAQSEEVGLLLVFSITIVSMGVILMMGVPTLNDAKENAQIQRVQTEFGSLDRQISSAAFGGGQTQARVNIQQGNFNFEPDAGWIKISYNNGTDIIYENKSLPSIRYTHVNSMISYQGGGIWTRYGDGSSVMVSPPDINLDGNTLSIALMNITSGGFQTAGARDLFTFTHNGSHRMQNFTEANPLSVGDLNLTIHSEHYRGWARYFNETGWPDVKVYSTNNTVKASNPTGSPPFGQALLSSGDQIQFKGSSGAKVNSYDSRVGNYSDDTSFGAGNIEARTIVNFQRESIVNGSVRSEGNIECNGCGDSIITGDALANGDIHDSDIDIRGTTDDDAGVRVNVPAPIESTIEDAISDFTTSFSSSLVSCPSTPNCEVISSGDYIASSNHNFEDTFRFDTTDGPVRLALTSSQFTIENDKLEIVGENPVIIFRGESGTNQAFRMRAVEMDVTDNRTDLFQVYVHPSVGGSPTKVELDDQGGTPTKFFGVIYAPYNKNVEIKDSEVFGSAIGEKLVLENSELHYDHSLVELELPSIGAPRISYLHAADNRIGAR